MGRQRNKDIPGCIGGRFQFRLSAAMQAREQSTRASIHQHERQFRLDRGVAFRCFASQRIVVVDGNELSFMNCIPASNSRAV